MTEAQSHQVPITPTNKVRVAKRANYDRETIHAILDDGLVAHVAFSLDNQPFVMPMVYGRIGDQLYIHGAKGTRMFRELKKGLPICLNVTLVDGFVVARSVFHHSMNYRSVNIHGIGRLVEDFEEKYDALVAVTDHLAPGRWDEARDTNEKEVKATSVIALDIETAAAKIRSGMPVDDEEDYDLDHWAGIVPISTAYGQPVNCSRLKDGIPVSDSIKRLVGRR